MAKRMKYHPHGSVLFCTFSLEEGLLLLSNPLCRIIIESCLARAQTLCPVKICHIVTEATHVHMILVVDNPDDVPGFGTCRTGGTGKTVLLSPNNTPLKYFNQRKDVRLKPWNVDNFGLFSEEFCRFVGGQ